MTPALRVATIGHRFPNAAIEIEVLGPLGIEVDWLGPLSRDEAVDAARHADAVLLGASFALDAAALGICAGAVRWSGTGSGWTTWTWTKPPGSE